MSMIMMTFGVTDNDDDKDDMEDESMAIVMVTM